MGYKIGFIGGGNMASALIQGILASKISNPEELFVSDKCIDKLEAFQALGIKTTQDNMQVVAASEYVFLAVKPKHLEEALEELELEDINSIFISIVAGWTTRGLERFLPETAKIVRVMPNTPALIGMGMLAISDDYNISEDELKDVRKILDTAGKTLIVERELMDAVTAVSGSGPAYVYMFIDAMADAGVRLGLTKDAALELAVQTVIGSAKMIEQTKQPPSVLKDKVCSPAGTTIEAVYRLQENNFAYTIMNAIEKCAAKSKEISETYDTAVNSGFPEIEE